MKTLNREQTIKFLTNAAVFSAPALAVFFALLAQGIPFEKAWPAAILVLYGLLADFFKKLKKS